MGLWIFIAILYLWAVCLAATIAHAFLTAGKHDRSYGSYEGAGDEPDW